MSFPWLAAGAGAAILAGVVLVGCRSQGARTTNLRPLAMTDLRRGTTSAIMEESVRVVRSSDEWDALWAGHSRLQLPIPPAPEVDFRDSMVVAVFCGQCPSAGYGVEIRDVVVSERPKSGKEILVRAHRSAPDPEVMVAQMVTAPFHFVRVPHEEGEPTLDWTDAGS